jgi:hypothetical protein
MEMSLPAVIAFTMSATPGSVAAPVPSCRVPTVSGAGVLVACGLSGLLGAAFPGAAPPAPGVFVHVPAGLGDTTSARHAGESPP